MNVYIVALARQLAALGTEVEVFTRATSSRLPPTAELAPGVTVRHVSAGPFDDVNREDLPAWLCVFAAHVLRVEAGHEEGWFDLVHSHYWLSGQVGLTVARQCGIPLVYTSHTLAKVKNNSLAQGDRPEPPVRVAGEEQVIMSADRLIASTVDEQRHFVELYGAPTERVDVVAPGVDLDVFRPKNPNNLGKSGLPDIPGVLKSPGILENPGNLGSPGNPAGVAEARRRIGIDPNGVLLLFVGRIQPLKAPDVLLRATADLVRRDSRLRDRLAVAVVGGPSGSGLDRPDALVKLAAELGLSDLVRFRPPAPQRELADWYRAATAVVVPSHSESFGLVALEAQACGTPVVASRVGGLRTAVADGRSGFLVPGHDPASYADVLARIINEPRLRRRLSAGAVRQAAGFGWTATARGVLASYRKALASATAAV